MRILISHHAFADFAGTESYIHTVAVALQRLGHDVTVYAERTGPMAAFSRERGMRVVETGGALPDWCDALLAHDAGTAFSLGERYPAPGGCSSPSRTTTRPDPAAARRGLPGDHRPQRSRRASVEAQAFHAPIIRLRQPIDTRRFVRARRRPGWARRALLLGNYLNGPPVQRFDAACRAAGIELVLAGARSTPTATPERTIADADVVFGLGRCVLEAMACARAAYVYGVAGGDGWVTPESYPAIEANGFAGTATPDVIDPDRLTADLRAWTPDLAAAGRALVTAHHDADSMRWSSSRCWETSASPALRLVRRWRSRAAGAAGMADLGPLRRRARRDPQPPRHWTSRARGQELHRTLAERHRRVAETAGAPSESQLAEQHHTLTEQHRILDEQILEFERLSQLPTEHGTDRHPGPAHRRPIARAATPGLSGRLRHGQPSSCRWRRRYDRAPCACSPPWLRRCLRLRWPRRPPPRRRRSPMCSRSALPSATRTTRASRSTTPATRSPCGPSPTISTPVSTHTRTRPTARPAACSERRGGSRRPASTRRTCGWR